MPENNSARRNILDVCYLYNNILAAVGEEGGNLRTASPMTVLEPYPVTNEPIWDECMMVGTGGEMLVWERATPAAFVVTAFAPRALHPLYQVPLPEMRRLGRTRVDFSDGVDAALSHFLTWMIEDCLPSFSSDVADWTWEFNYATVAQHALLRLAMRRGGEVHNELKADTPAGQVLTLCLPFLCTMVWTLDGRSEAFPDRSLTSLISEGRLLAPSPSIQTHSD